MNDRNVDQLLDAWLDLGPDVAPDRVHSAVALEVRTTRQAFGWSRWASERFPSMNNPVRIAVALAAVAVVAIVGIRFLLPPDNTGDRRPTTTPTASPSPTATPVAIPSMPPEHTRLDAGQYTLEVPDSTVTATITVGDGWTSGGWYIMNPPAFTKDVSFWTVGNVNADACDWGGTLPDPPIGPTVDDLVAALDAQTNTRMSAAVDVVLGGYPGKRITMKSTEALDCPTVDSLVMWADPNGQPGRGLIPAGPRDNLWILDVDGQRVVIVSSQGDPEDTDATTTIAAVLDSLEFDVN